MKDYIDSSSEEQLIQGSIRGFQMLSKQIASLKLRDVCYFSAKDNQFLVRRKEAKGRENLRKTLKQARNLGKDFPIITKDSWTNKDFDKDQLKRFDRKAAEQDENLPLIVYFDFNGAIRNDEDMAKAYLTYYPRGVFPEMAKKSRSKYSGKKNASKKTRRAVGKGGSDLLIY